MRVSDFDETILQNTFISEFTKKKTNIFYSMFFGRKMYFMNCKYLQPKFVPDIYFYCLHFTKQILFVYIVFYFYVKQDLVSRGIK